MKTTDLFNMQSEALSLFEMNIIRGGSSGGGGVTEPHDEDILLPDPDPEKAE